MQADEKIQLIVVGESSVGKTSILFNYTNKTFTHQHLATVGLEYFFKDEKIEDKLIKVKIWDTAGQENFKSMTRNFYRTSNGVVLVYDVSNKSTFEKIQEWIQSIYDNSDIKIKIVLVGNKIDLPREVTTEEGRKLAEYYKIPFYETSAKENIGVREMMRKLITNVLDGFKPSQGFQLDQQLQVKKGCGC